MKPKDSKATTKARSPVPASGYSDATRIAVQETAARVQEMHQAIAGKSFDVLTKIPVVSGPATIAKAIHDAVSGGIYAAIHHGAGGALGAAALIERHLPERGQDAPPGRIASSVRSALNGVFGDHLEQIGNVLAIEMGIYVQGRPVAIESAALAATFPKPGMRLCVLIHGLACDEHCWEPAAADALDFGARLNADFGFTPLYLRYNTGLPIDENATRLSALLERLLTAWPVPVETLLLIGHSMGGLVARQACERAVADALAWPEKTCMLACLGSPHLGAPLERLGQLANKALDATRVTAPLGRIAAARSQGIKDLRHGLRPDPKTTHQIALRFIGSSLTDDVDHPLAEWLGDGLVTLGSATGHPLVGDVESTRLGGIAHMALTTDARVYACLQSWLKAIAAP